MTEQDVNKLIAFALRPLLSGYDMSYVIDRLDPPEPKKTDYEVAVDLATIEPIELRASTIEEALKEARNG